MLTGRGGNNRAFALFAAQATEIPVYAAGSDPYTSGRTVQAALDVGSAGPPLCRLLK